MPDGDPVWNGAQGEPPRARTSWHRREDGRVKPWIKWGGIPTIVAGGIATYFAIGFVQRGEAALEMAEQAGRDHPAVVENTRARHDQAATNAAILTTMKQLVKSVDRLADVNAHARGRLPGRPGG